MIKALLLDLDGTLLDEERAWTTATTAFYKAHSQYLKTESLQSFQQRSREIVNRHWSRYVSGELDFIGQQRERAREALGYLDRQLRIREHYDTTYVSCEMGSKKPDSEFCAAVGKQWPGLKLVFWDDRPENVYAAEACGWTAYVFQDAATLETDINRLFGPA